MIDGCRYRLAYLFVVVDMVTPQVFMMIDKEYVTYSLSCVYRMENNNIILPGGPRSPRRWSLVGEVGSV